MRNLSEYLLDHRGIKVSPSDANDLEKYWNALRQRRSRVDESALSGEEVPVLFNPLIADDEIDE